MILLKVKRLFLRGIKILSFCFLVQITLLTAPYVLAEDKIAFSSGSIEQENPPSNEEFLRSSLRSLFEKAFNNFPEANSKLIFLKAEEDHPANWLLEDELISYLLSLKYQVGSSAPDSIYSLSESISLFYRIIELKLDYPKVQRKGFLGTKLVTRKVSLNLSLRLEDESTGKVLWSKREKQEKMNLVKKSMIKSLNNESYPFLSPSLSGDSQGKYLEPALLTAVVGGLIYLFFANR